MKLNIAKSVTYERRPVPDQTARPPMRIPRSQTAAMMLLQALSRDHQYWTCGACQRGRLPVLVGKFDERFAVLDPSRTRTRKRGSGFPTSRMVVYPQRDTDRWLWWLLVAGRQSAVEQHAGSYNETLYPIHHRPTALAWADEYDLRRGPRGSMTWWLQRKAANDIEGELRYLASAHGRAGERTDDLERAVTRARNRPMFAGVRQQIGRALNKSVRAWTKTHKPGVDYPADSSRLPWFAGSVQFYDDPPAVVVAD